MDLPLSPLEFARRARRLYPDREAVVDGEQRWTYAQFFDRCDRWSAALQKLGIGKGDRNGRRTARTSSAARRRRPLRGRGTGGARDGRIRAATTVGPWLNPAAAMNTVQMICRRRRRGRFVGREKSIRPETATDLDPHAIRWVRPRCHARTPAPVPSFGLGASCAPDAARGAGIEDGTRVSQCRACPHVTASASSLRHAAGRAVRKGNR